MDVFYQLQKALIEPSPPMSASHDRLSCFLSNINSTAQCSKSEEITCQATDAHADCTTVNPLDAVPTNVSSLSFSRMQREVSGKMHVSRWASIKCNRTNCNSPTMYKEVLELLNPSVAETSTMPPFLGHPTTKRSQPASKDALLTAATHRALLDHTHPLSTTDKQSNNLARSLAVGNPVPPPSNHAHPSKRQIHPVSLMVTTVMLESFFSLLQRMTP